ncbi:MAG: type II toxin-antitoxin system prevent-host-death family antitoxin [Trueperaceae bacterium]|nr:MAG: type II toxin-antitoxin system prevent-host-death family antitoxin [Trueperaceae bacterium]
MLEVNVREARTKLSSLLDLVEQGGEVNITRRGKVIARLVPTREFADPQRVIEEAAALRQKIEENHGLRENPVLQEREEARY